MSVITIRVPKELRDELEEVARLLGKDKSDIVREILAEGLREKRVEYALRLYREGRVSLWKAARIAGATLWEMIEALGRYGVEVQYTLEDALKDIEAAKADTKVSEREESRS